MPGVRTNLWKLYAYKFISEFYLVVPILIPYYVSHGLSSTQVFTIQAAYALAVLLLEVPSGYLADVIGRRATLILGTCFLVGMTLVLVSLSRRHPGVFDTKSPPENPADDNPGALNVS